MGRHLIEGISGGFVPDGTNASRCYGYWTSFRGRVYLESTYSRCLGRCGYKSGAAVTRGSEMT